MRPIWPALLGWLLLCSCAFSPSEPLTTAQRLDGLLPADVLLLGEQHDASDHQRLQLEIVSTLAARGELSGLLIEMAEQGKSTLGLGPRATEEEVKESLAWNQAGWPWAAYGPTVMVAVRSGVLVQGANLPRSGMRAAMNQSELDGRLPGPALKAQQQLIRLGHCDMLPESQIGPMTRIQIARDLTMAQSVERAVQEGKVLVLLAGFGHVDKLLGIPQHLPGNIRVKAVRLGEPTAQKDARASAVSSFDFAWPALPAPEKDHCEAFRAQVKPAV